MTYADVSNITTFTVDENYSSGHRFKWDVSHSAFNNVGPITQGACCGMSPGGYFRHVMEYFMRRLPAARYSQRGTRTVVHRLEAGSSDIVGNVFDKAF